MNASSNPVEMTDFSNVPPLDPNRNYEAMERESLGDFEKQTGIYYSRIGEIMTRFVQRQDVPIGVRSEISTEARALVERVHELEKAIRELFVFSEMIDETLVIRLPYDVAKRVSGLVARP